MLQGLRNLTLQGHGLFYTVKLHCNKMRGKKKVIQLDQSFKINITASRIIFFVLHLDFTLFNVKIWFQTISLKFD